MEIRTIIEERLWENVHSINELLKPFQEDLLSIDFESELSDNRFLIDRFPVPLRYPLSDELEIFYDDCKEEMSKYSYYLQEEQRFIKTIQQLWTLSSAIATSNLSDRDIDRLKDIVDDHNSLLETYENASKKPMFEIDSNRKMELLTRLSLREKIHTCFIFPEIKLIVRSNGLIFELYLGDQSKKELVQLICSTHGLYLRK
ncbi:MULTISPECIES: hypothetical protein [Brevibacillus]|uniref:hypothetical protein n=1 Tax=Brevibacillus TaxID=55080 RepID=UPI000D0E8115|nr:MULTISPECIES: hypothetical protein [Brevibacillus]MED1947051.1 hypothetical protein [Brevibacillus formosus]MED2000473.1 hypothetical protein [Brevibacillus formosus]MED2085738.1 hypothetical protein [Brevibacillus formosus]PSJ66621.1 hypothetical protein C7J99_24860 [Brevibacillus brevis]PSK13501.1 hypothetical protein C7R94_22720 [Brevibacillus sp. NRRL NRS-603]